MDGTDKSPRGWIVVMKCITWPAGFSPRSQKEYKKKSVKNPTQTQALRDAERIKSYPQEQGWGTNGVRSPAMRHRAMRVRGTHRPMINVCLHSKSTAESHEKKP